MATFHFDPYKPQKLKAEDPNGAGGLTSSFAYVVPGAHFSGDAAAFQDFKDLLLRGLELAQRERARKAQGRGTCPVCKRRYPLTKQGVIGSHRGLTLDPVRGYTEYAYCPGWGLEPTERRQTLNIDEDPHNANWLHNE